MQISWYFLDQAEKRDLCLRLDSRLSIFGGLLLLILIQTLFVDHSSAPPHFINFFLFFFFFSIFFFSFSMIDCLFEWMWKPQKKYEKRKNSFIINSNNEIDDGNEDDPWIDMGWWCLFLIFDVFKAKDYFGSSLEQNQKIKMILVSIQRPIYSSLRSIFPNYFDV